MVEGVVALIGHMERKSETAIARCMPCRTDGTDRQVVADAPRKDGLTVESLPAS
ncbi:hypothetical protein [Streptomyces sp. NPDC001833]|uniref:hypothetical protein n=1 Tax=Streptomyces sp. NPDC001833 TaxID=3154658 RepID=UPI00332DAAFF